MADLPMADSAKPTEAKPRPQAAAVIRRMAVSQEDARERLLKRQLPAWVISGAIHLVFIAIFIVFFSGEAAPIVEANDNLIETIVTETPEEPEPDLSEMNLGLRAEIQAADDAERNLLERPEEPVIPEDPVMVPNDDSLVPTQPISPQGNDVAPPKSSDEGPGNRPESTDDSRGAPGMRNRVMTGDAKARMIELGGGNDVSEAAVARGLIWLAKQQKNDGRWVYDGTSSGDFIAATGMAILPFLASGQTHKPSDTKSARNYQKNVDGGLKFLLSRQKPTGDFTGASSMYASAISTIALCEAYGMTNDPALKKPAQLALNFIMRAQADNGSWGYASNSRGDTSIVGWQIQALKSGKIAGLIVSDDVMKKANTFLDTVAGESGATYGYTSRSGTPTLSAVGLLCRQYVAGWGPRNPSLAAGVKLLIDKSSPDKTKFDMYLYYYASQVVFFHGGANWTKHWNPKMRDLLIDLQVKAASANQGSWDPDQGSIGNNCGRLGTTCLALLTLEVYYRHLPLYKRDAAGLKEIDP